MMMLAKHSSLLRKESSKHAARTMSALTHPAYWSKNMSFAAPESDFCAPDHFASSTASPSTKWSNSLTFASPESDFTASNVQYNEDMDYIMYRPSDSETMLQSVSLSSSPESALGAVHFTETLDGPLKSQLKKEEPDSMASYFKTNQDADYSPSEMEGMLQSALLSSSPESALGAVHLSEILDETLKSQLRKQHPDTMASYLKNNQDAEISPSEAMLQSVLLSASPESALGAVHLSEIVDGPLKNQLQEQQSNSMASYLKHQQDEESIPTEEMLQSVLLSSSPENALGAVHLSEMLDVNSKHQLQEQQPDSMASYFKHSQEYSPSELEAMLQSVLLSASPESALGAIHLSEMVDEPLKNQLQELEADSTASYLKHSQEYSSSELEATLQSLTLAASPESILGAVHMGEFLDGPLKSQLGDHQERLARQESLPKSLSAALADSRPIVVTSASSPFSVVEVNDAWVGLCGYTREEALDRNLGDLLQGPDTNTQVAKQMVAHLARENYGEAVLTNYAKSGRKFHNFVKIGKLSANDQTAEFFVGVLEEIAEEALSSGMRQQSM